MAGQRAFSLVEIAIALGVVSFALVAVLGLMQVGLAAMRAAIEDTITSTILHDAKNRANGTDFIDRSATNGKALDYYYDADGRFLSDTDLSATGGTARIRFRAEVTLADPGVPGDIPDTKLKAMVLTLNWPMNGKNVPASKAGSQLKVSFYVTPLTEHGWQLKRGFDGALPNYTPKVEL